MVMKRYHQWDRRAIIIGKEELSSVGKKSYHYWEGREELSSVLKTIDGLFLRHSVLIDSLRTDFTKLKLFWLSDYSHLT